MNPYQMALYLTWEGRLDPDWLEQVQGRLPTYETNLLLDAWEETGLVLSKKGAVAL